jgi:hypothetical protein
MSAWLTLERIKPRSKKEEPQQRGVGAQRLEARRLQARRFGAKRFGAAWQMPWTQCDALIVKPVRQRAGGE